MSTCATQIVYHDLYGERGFTALRSTWNRYHLFLSQLALSPLSTTVPVVEAPACTENDLLRVHASTYIDYIQELDLRGNGKVDGSTPAWHGMYARAERVVGGTLLAADLLASGASMHVFNPAGGQHHAHHDRGGGFCIFNDVVCAVRSLQAQGFGRIAVLDIDGHHGDGTASLLIREDTLVISLHEFGERTYPGSGKTDEIGHGPGRGFTANFPLVRGTGNHAYLSILDRAVVPLLQAYSPDVLIVQFGTDAHWADPLLHLRLSTRGFFRLAQHIHDLAHALCGGRLLVVGGGGYEPEQVVRSWLLLLAQLCGSAPGWAHPEALAWLEESGPGAQAGANESSLQAADEARRLLFPLHGLNPGETPGFT